MKNKKAIVISLALLLALLFIGSASAASRGPRSKTGQFEKAPTTGYRSEYGNAQRFPARTYTQKPLTQRPMRRGALVRDITPAQRRMNLKRRIAKLKAAKRQDKEEIRRLERKVRRLDKQQREGVDKPQRERFGKSQIVRPAKRRMYTRN